MAAQEQKITAQSWAMLGLLSLIWGGSFFFVGVAVKELPALLIVFARVTIAAAILIPLHLMLQGPLPRDARTWVACGVMALMNNVVPFTAISWGQHSIGSGLAAVLNATTPMFGALFMALFGLEAFTARRLIALGLGVVGVGLLKGGGFGELGPQAMGILAVTLASASYGLSAPWSKTRLMGLPPLTTATCQLSISTLVMGLLAFGFSNPAQYLSVSHSTWAALAGLAAISTSLAYLIFFRILTKTGPSFTILVTMLIPVSAIILGVVFLGESFTANEALGTGIIALALIIIDGRLIQKLGFSRAAPQARP